MKTKTRFTLIATAMAMAAPALASADTMAGLGFDNVHISLGAISASVPAGKLTIGHIFPTDATGIGFTAVGGSGDGLNFQRVQVRAEKLLPLDGGVLAPEAVIGDVRVGGLPQGHVSAAYAGVGAAYIYQMGQYAWVTANATAGRDFGLHATGYKTADGTYYQAGADLDIGGVGPGILAVGYDYRHLPVARGLKLNTSGFQAVYNIIF